MAIQFARIEFVSRSKGGRACIKGAYNSREKIQEFSSGKVFHFKNRANTLYHKVFLPDYVDQKFCNVSELMNEVEKSEKRKNSVLLKEVVIALPKEEIVGDEGRAKILENFIQKMGWIRERLGVQADIHPPHGEKDKNYHAHILVTTRRFKDDGSGLGAKARDLEPDFRHGGGKNFIVKEDKMISKIFREVQEEYFQKEGLNLSVDSLSKYPEIRIGPKRFRTDSAANLIKINESRKIKNLQEIFKNPNAISEKISERQIVFTKNDVRKFLNDFGIKDEKLVVDAVESSKVRPLLHVSGWRNSDEEFLGQYVRKDVWEQLERVMRNAERVSKECLNVKLHSDLHREYIKDRVRIVSNYRKFDKESREALYKLAIHNSGVKVLRGAAGTGKSRILAGISEVYEGNNVIGIAPTNKAVNELREKGIMKVDTVARFLWKLEKGKSDVKWGSVVLVDEAGMVGNSSYDRLFSFALKNKLSIILCGDERQLGSIERGGIFDKLYQEYNVSQIERIKRQIIGEDIRISKLLANGKIWEAVKESNESKRIFTRDNSDESIRSLIFHWNKSNFAIEDRLILAVSNEEVRTLNRQARESIFGKDSWDSDILLKREILIKDPRGFGYEKQLVSEGYQEGERLVFTGNNKELGIYNGDFASLVSIKRSEKKFVVRLDREGALKEFNPMHFGKFTHGYASTVYKAQGATVKDVYILHSGYGNKKNSYVALTRHSHRFSLFINIEDTKDLKDLAAQLSSDREILISDKHRIINNYEVIRRNLSKKSRTGKFFSKVLDRSESVHKWLSDRFGVEKVKNFEMREEMVQSLEFRDVVKSEKLDQKLEIKPRVELEQKISDKIDTLDKKISVNASVDENKVKRNFVTAARVKKIREFLKDRSKEFGIRILEGRGEVINKKLSNSEELRFGKNGNFSLVISGYRKGSWYDFKSGFGGDLISLVQREKKLNFKDSLRYIERIYSNEKALVSKIENIQSLEKSEKVILSIP